MQAVGDAFHREPDFFLRFPANARQLQMRGHARQQFTRAEISLPPARNMNRADAL